MGKGHAGATGHASVRMNCVCCNQRQKALGEWGVEVRVYAVGLGLEFRA